MPVRAEADEVPAVISSDKEGDPDVTTEVLKVDSSVPLLVDTFVEPSIRVARKQYCVEALPCAGLDTVTAPPTLLGKVMYWSELYIDWKET